jgi:hypothetical protein
MEEKSERLYDIISMIKDAVSFADWSAVEEAIKELKYIADDVDFEDELEDFDDEDYDEEDENY